MSRAFEIFVHFDELHELVWRPGARDRTIMSEDPRFIDYLVRTFVWRFKSAIRTQKLNSNLPMVTAYPPLNEDYRKRKKKQGLRIGFWEATGQIANTIEGKRVGHSNTWKIGWDKRRTYRKAMGGGTLGPSTGVRIWLIVMWLEFGTKRNGEVHIPPRPLIRPIMRDMRKSITRLYLRYLRDRGILTTQEIREMQQMGRIPGGQRRRGTLSGPPGRYNVERYR